MTKFLLTPYLRLFFRIRVEGREHIPRQGPAILASNHISFCDSFFLPLVVPRRVRYIAKAEYFDNWKVAWFFRANGHIPLRRGEGADWKRALDGAAEALAAGELFGIYPEGTRSKDGRLHRGHTGVAMLAARTGAPVVPIGFTGTDKAQPVGSKMIWPFKRITIRIGPPVDLGAPTEGPKGQRALRAMTDAVMTDIQKLSGQEYTGKYAPLGDRT
ncbi:MAG TPA: lysophospholipid acyltransferase family protein [Acidimicrobiia bacterium]|jgi:1-acyl-sn-glycerol-3-phosphate acyltransferase